MLVTVTICSLLFLLAPALAVAATTGQITRAETDSVWAFADLAGSVYQAETSQKFPKNPNRKDLNLRKGLDIQKSCNPTNPPGNAVGHRMQRWVPEPQLPTARRQGGTGIRSAPESSSCGWVRNCEGRDPPRSTSRE